MIPFWPYALVCVRAVAVQIVKWRRITGQKTPFPLKEVLSIAYLLAVYVSLLIHSMYLLGSDEKAAVWLTFLFGKDDPHGPSPALAAILNTKVVGGIVGRIKNRVLDLHYEAGSTEIETEAMRIIVETLPQQLRESLNGKTLQHAVNAALQYLSCSLGGFSQDLARDERWWKTISAQQYGSDQIDSEVDFGSTESSRPPLGADWGAQQKEHWGFQNQEKKKLEAQERQTINFEQVALMIRVTPRELRSRIASGKFPKEPKGGYTRAFVSDWLTKQTAAIRAAGFHQNAVAKELARQTGKNKDAVLKWLKRNQDKVPRLPNGNYSPANIRRAAKLICRDRRKHPVRKKKASSR